MSDDNQHQHQRLEIQFKSMNMTVSQIVWNVRVASRLCGSFIFSAAFVMPVNEMLAIDQNTI